jgi:hypothetical protein
MWRLFYVWTNTFGKVYTLYIIVQRAEAQKSGGSASFPFRKSVLQKTCVDVYFSTSHISMPNSNGLFAHPEKLRPDFVVKGRKRIIIWDITNSSMPCW